MLRLRQTPLLVPTVNAKRWKSRNSKSSVNNKKSSKDLALEKLDDFYGSVFGNRWKNIRIALLSNNKYISMINNFGDRDKTCKSLESIGAINIRDLVLLEKEKLVLENNSLINNENVSYKTDNVISSIIKEQEIKEMKSLYPEAADLEDKIGNSIEVKRIVNVGEGTGGLYQFVPATKIKGMEDWIPESDHYKYYKTSEDFPLTFEMEKDFTVPENLLLYTFEMGNTSDFMTPMKCSTGVLSHYLMDGGSILPPLFLGPFNKGERILDACAAPGGKSLLLLQNITPDCLVCNDVQRSRLKRIRKVMQEYVFDFEEKWEGKRCILSKNDARNLQDFDSYDKVLVDAPCTTDRHSLHKDDNNIFKGGRIKERLRLPELQSEILANSIRLLKPGGSLVYSTCSLSPVQNDGVVHMALQKVFQDYNITCTIKDLSFVIRFFSTIFKFENSQNLKYGQLVLPYLPANFGPMYFCKIVRN